jgi:hypothetical protein
MIRKKSDTEVKLDAEIQAALDELDKYPNKTSEEYGTIVDRIAKLHKLKSEERTKPISPDTALVVVANVLGIIWITQHERVNVISTKALGFIMKPRS